MELNTGCCKPIVVQRERRMHSGNWSPEIKFNAAENVAPARILTLRLDALGNIHGIGFTPNIGGSTNPPPTVSRKPPALK